MTKQVPIKLCDNIPNKTKGSRNKSLLKTIIFKRKKMDEKVTKTCFS